MIGGFTMIYEMMEDVMIEIDHIDQTANDDAEYVGEIKRLLRELKSQENVE